MCSKQTNAETLKESIVELIIKHLKSGEKLPSEKEMMQAFNVSRTSLREVLSAYEANGILESRQGSGYYVQTPNISKQILNTWSILLHATPNLFLTFWTSDGSWRSTPSPGPSSASAPSSSRI